MSIMFNTKWYAQVTSIFCNSLLSAILFFSAILYLYHNKNESLFLFYTLTYPAFNTSIRRIDFVMIVTAGFADVVKRWNRVLGAAQLY